MSWGVRTIGFANVIDSLEAVELEMSTDATYVVGTNVEYSIFVEFGTSQMEAQPYLRPATRQAARRLDALADQASSGDDLIRLLALDIERRSKQIVPVDTGTLRSSLRAERVN